MVKQLIDGLKAVCESATSGIVLPMKVQKGDTELSEKSPTVYRMRLPISTSYDKYAPYIIIQYTNSKHGQKHGDRPHSDATIRLIFCVCNEESEEDGAMELLNVMEAVQQELLMCPVISERFILDTNADLEMMVYPDDTAPYFAGEMIGTFQMPPVYREVSYE